MKRLILIDSNAVIHRAYHALPKTMSNRKGEQTNAIYGFTTTLIKALEDLHPDYVAASFDVGKVTFRTEQYKEYKATRIKADQELYDQIPRIKELLSVFSIPIYEKEGFEADDCIGTIVKNCHEHNKMCKNIPLEGMEVYIVSGDKDIYQLIDGNIFVYSLRKGLSQMAIVDRKVIKEEYNLDPEDFIDLKALAGDASDNIPGVPGIGPKTATDLLQKYDSLEKLYKKIDILLNGYIVESNTAIQQYSNELVEKIARELKLKPRIVKLLLDYKDQAFLSQSLATIHKEVPIEFDLKDAFWGEYDKEKARSLFEELGFHSLLKRFGVEERGEPKTKEAKDQEKKDEQLKLL